MSRFGIAIYGLRVNIGCVTLGTKTGSTSYFMPIKKKMEQKVKGGALDDEALAVLEKELLENLEETDIFHLFLYLRVAGAIWRLIHNNNLINFLCRLSHVSARLRL